jgi:hypothetical protein
VRRRGHDRHSPRAEQEPSHTYVRARVRESRRSAAAQQRRTYLGWVSSGGVADCVRARGRDPIGLELFDCHCPPLLRGVAGIVAAQHSLLAPPLCQCLVPLAQARTRRRGERAAGSAVTAWSRATRNGHHPQYRARVRAREAAPNALARVQRLSERIRTRDRGGRTCLTARLMVGAGSRAEPSQPKRGRPKERWTSPRTRRSLSDYGSRSLRGDVRNGASWQTGRRQRPRP